MGVNAAPDLGVKDEAECVNDVVAVTASAKDGVVRVVRVIGEAEKGVEELADGGATTDFADERVEHVRGEAEESAGKGLNVVKVVAGGGEGGVAGTGGADDVEVDVDLGGGASAGRVSVAEAMRRWMMAWAAPCLLALGARRSASESVGQGW